MSVFARTRAHIRAIERRIAALEQTLRPVPCGPAFVMAASRAKADREIERLRAEFGDAMPKTMFVMICSEPEVER